VRICVIFNPVARGDKARRFRAQLDQIGLDAVLKLTRCPGDARNLAAQAVTEGFDCVVAAGGDGTLNEVLNGLGDAAGGFDQAALGVLPLGTVNVFARELAVPFDLSSAWQVILAGKESRIDVACAEHGEKGVPQRRWFVQLAGAGLDARSIELVDWDLKKRIGPLAYVWAGLKAVLEHKPLIHASASAGGFEGELVLIGNGRLYGGDFATFDQAQLNDGRLDVCVFPRANLLTLLHCAPRLLLTGRLPNVVRRFQAEEFTLTSATPASFELDGELAGSLPVKFSVLHQRLRVRVP
jgi:diacylglycerol kinase (ATP)